MTYTGDVLISINTISNEAEITYQNGQPEMTGGFESCVLLAVFGKDCAQNGMIIDPAEKFDSTFWQVIDRANVNDETKNNGTKAIEKALKFMTDLNMASSVIVTGQIINTRSIGWAIDIYSPDGIRTKYALNWEQGKLTMGYGI